MFLNLSSAFFQSESRPLRDASSFLVADIKFSLAFCLAQIKHSTESFSQFVVMKPQGTAQTIFAERNDFACLGWNVELTLKGPELGREKVTLKTLAATLRRQMESARLKQMHQYSQFEKEKNIPAG